MSSPLEAAPDQRAANAANERLLLTHDGADGNIAGWTLCGWPEAEDALRHSWDVVALEPEYLPEIDSYRGTRTRVLALLRSFVESGGSLVALLPPPSSDNQNRIEVLGVLGRVIDSSLYDLCAAAGDRGTLHGYRWTIRRGSRGRAARPDRVQVVPAGPQGAHLPPVVAYTGMSKRTELVVGSHYWTRGRGRVVLLPTRPRNFFIRVLATAATVPALDLGGHAVGGTDPRSTKAGTKRAAAHTSVSQGAPPPRWGFPEVGTVVVPDLGTITGVDKIGWYFLRRLAATPRRLVPLVELYGAFEDLDEEPEETTRFSKSTGRDRTIMKRVRGAFRTLGDSRGVDKEMMNAVIKGGDGGYRLFPERLVLQDRRDESGSDAPPGKSKPPAPRVGDVTL